MDTLEIASTGGPFYLIKDLTAMETLNWTANNEGVIIATDTGGSNDGKPGPGIWNAGDYDCQVSLHIPGTSGSATSERIDTRNNRKLKIDVSETPDEYYILDIHVKNGETNQDIVVLHGTEKHGGVPIDVDISSAKSIYFHVEMTCPSWGNDVTWQPLIIYFYDYVDPGIFNLYHNSTQIRSITGKTTSQVTVNGTTVFKPN